MMIDITRTSPITNETICMEIEITQDQYDAWKSGVLIQDAMPDLSADDREYIMTGMTPEDWDKLNSD
jgi:hypothetical protein|tara:strand:- start:309 stop:509 length:201 start_codon:yes stop_codon:yes gene_type:complete